MTSPLRVGIIGCGLVGTKRAEALDGDDLLVAGYDVGLERSSALAERFRCSADASRETLLARELDVVIVATPHNVLASNAIAALESGAHVLVEKPAGIGTAEIKEVAAVSERVRRRVKVGFNHRFAPAIERAVLDARSGRFGEIMFARARYGHGGRVGYEREWRMNPQVSGGGELVDQGAHVIDLFHWLFGPLPVHSALLRRQFWNAEVEDNAVLVLGQRGEEAAPWALAHVTWTEWKNMFSLEIYCRTAKLEVEGLGGSYGPQQLTVYEMRPEMGPPDTQTHEYGPEDVTWRREWQHFRETLATGSASMRGDLEDASYAWRCVERAYELNGECR